MNGLTRKTKSIIVIITVTIFICYIFLYAVPKSGEIALANFKKFYSTSIQGKIRACSGIYPSIKRVISDYHRNVG